MQSCEAAEQPSVLKNIVMTGKSCLKRLLSLNIYMYICRWCWTAAALDSDVFKKNYYISENSWFQTLNKTVQQRLQWFTILTQLLAEPEAAEVSPVSEEILVKVWLVREAGAGKDGARTGCTDHVGLKPQGALMSHSSLSPSLRLSGSMLLHDTWRKDTKSWGQPYLVVFLSGETNKKFD